MTTSICCLPITGFTATFVSANQVFTLWKLCAIECFFLAFVNIYEQQKIVICIWSLFYLFVIDKNETTKTSLGSEQERGKCIFITLIITRITILMTTILIKTIVTWPVRKKRIFKAYDLCLVLSMHGYFGKNVCVVSMYYLRFLLFFL